MLGSNIKVQTGDWRLHALIFEVLRAPRFVCIAVETEERKTIVTQ